MLKKLETGWLFGLAGSAYLFSLGFMLMTLSAPSASRSTVLGSGIGAAVSFFACIALVLLYRSVRLQWEEGRRVIISIQMKLLPIDAVEQRLGQLADEFMALCQEQVQFQNAESAVAEAIAIEGRITRAKSAFWEAHALAKELGYAMKESVSDYASVPKAPARRRGKKVA